MWRYFHRKRYSQLYRRCFLTAYNGAYHRSIKRAPDEVGDRNELDVWKTLYGKNKKKDVEKTLQVGDVVRLSMVTRPFRKGYLPQWTEEIFVVDKVIRRQPTVYAVKDFDGEEVAGTFYAEELQKIGKKETDALYKIEHILRSRKRKDGTKEYLVKWYGYPAKFNSWVADVVKLR